MRPKRLTQSQVIRRRVFMALGVLSALLIGVTVCFVTVSSTERERYELHILELEQTLEQGKKVICVAAKKLEAGTVLSASDIEYIEALKDFGAGTAMPLEGRCLLVALDQGEEITPSLTGESSLFEDERQVQFEDIQLPAFLKEGDIIDIRLKKSDGSDLVVLSKKKVIALDHYNLRLDLFVDETELFRMNSALSSLSREPGRKLYITGYVAPLYQKASEITYIGD